MEYKFVGLELGRELWKSKLDLFQNFYGDFYKFIKTHGGKKDLLAHNIHNVKDFYAFADFYAEGKDSCYAMGFAFHKYYVVDRMDGSLETEPETSFIGWCMKNKKYQDFLQFLVTFFAWWRNDEGCTRFDPYNYADNFFVSSWAILVDTTKLFYFTAETVYHWHSYRVKYVLDNIPGTFLSPLPKKGLPKIRVAGYEFKGWFDGEDENAKEVTDVNAPVAYAKLVRKDHYDYWGKEEPKIKKVYDPNWSKVDPA